MVEQSGKENGVQEQRFLSKIKDLLRIILKKWMMKKSFLLMQRMEFS
jgi:hypothetical protein